MDIDVARISWPYLAGFTDGDGGIKVLDPRIDSPSGGWVRIAWCQSEANASVLEPIKGFLIREGINRVNDRKFTVAESGHKHPQIGLYISRQDEVFDVLAHMLPFLVLKKDAALRGIEVLTLVREYTARYGKRRWLSQLRQEGLREAA